MNLFDGGPQPHPLKAGKLAVIDLDTGGVIEERRNAMTLLPPGPGVCPVCAVDHAHDAPHNQQSLYYRMAFAFTHGRAPTWSDAMAHCAPDVRAVWRRELVKSMRAHGLDVPPDLLDDVPASAR